MSWTSALKALVVVPTYNEVDNVRLLAENVWQHVPNVHLLFVDDNSTDGTRKVVRELMAERPGQVFLLERERKLGLGTAYVAAFKWGLARDYDALIEMDADHSHRPEDLAKILRRLSNAPVVIGSRYCPGGGTQNWGLSRRLISRLGSLYAGLVLRLTVRDLTGGFNAWRREVIEAIDPASIGSEGYAFQVELKYRAHLAGYPLAEEPILFVERRAGHSKMSGGIIGEAIYRIWQLALQRGAIRSELAARRARPVGVNAGS